VGEGELGLSHADVASNMLLRTLDFDRREDRVWKLHGRAEFERGFIWNAIGSLREAVRLHPFDAEAAVRLGRACVENKIFDEAQTVLYKVSVYAPNFVDLWEPLAAAYYQQGKFKEAVMAYDWMIYFDNNAQAAYANKAAAQGSLGTLPEALLTLKQAEQRFPLDGKIKINLAITYLKLGMRGEAKAAWKEANRLLPSDPQVDQLRKVLR
jgi:tetratricopeptide (TPR) repeat protein